MEMTRKAVVDVATGESSFGSCCTWEGADDLPRGRICLRKLRAGEGEKNAN